ncbi:MAG: transposase [Candidatus Competibacter sp.]
MMPDKRYPSDLTDEEWTVVEECLRLEEEIGVGRPLEVELRRVWDAIFYLNKTGCQWAYLPHDFPPRTTVNYHYMKWMTSGLFERVNAQIRRAVRKKTVKRKNRARGLSTVKASKAPPNLARNPALTVGRK